MDSKDYKDPKKYKADEYRDLRPDYPLEFLKCIKSHLNKNPYNEDETSSELKVHNIGCGPGKACHGLSQLFSFVYATDPSSFALKESPSFPNVEYKEASAQELSEKYEAHSANLCFFGLSLHFIGVDEGIKVARYLMKNNSPSIMAVSGYHHPGYILDPTHVPQYALKHFSRAEKIQDSLNAGDQNNNPVYCEDISEFYPDNMNQTLVNEVHYPSNKDATDLLRKVTSFIIPKPTSIMRASEYTKEQIDFKSKKKIYFHVIEKTCLQDLMKSTKAFEHNIPESFSESFKQYMESFSSEMIQNLNLESENDPIYLGRFFFSILCSDNIDF